MNDETVKLYLLGSPKIVLDGRSHADLLIKAQALLFYLALEPGEHSRAALAALLWSELPEERARGNLRTALSRLKPHFEPYLRIGRSGIALARERLWVDAVAFERGLAEPALAARRAALDLYRGELLADFQLRDAPAYEEWLLLARVRLRQLAVDGLERLADDTWQRGEGEEALADYRRLLALDSYREGAHRGIMRLLAAQGDRAGALAQFEQCRQILAGELGIEPAPATRQLREEIRQGVQLSRREEPAAAPPASEQTVPSAPPGNLPFPTTSFHGRSAELAQIENALAEEGCRLLTLTGLGGVGKSRLALAAAHRLREARADLFPDGLFWVSLAAATTGNGAVAAIAGALGFQFSGPADGQTQLFSYLRHKRLLLVLDNLEQLVPAAPLFSELLQQAPGVALLATSREKLNLYEEWRLPVGGLPYPAAGDRPEAFEAVQLFVQRARRVDMGFDWRPQAADVVALCRLLEGLPLGLELAAAWVHVISLQEITAAISRSQAELAVSWQNTPERHHSLAATLAYSWRLLTPAEQAALARLAVFRQGFTATAAGEVAGAAPRLLADLVEKSLVRPAGSGRYDLHEQVRQFAWERLGEDREGALAGHRRFFAAYLGERGAAVAGPEQGEILQEIDREGENVRLAWAQGVQGRAIDDLARMAGTLFHFYTKRGRQREGLEIFGAAVTMLAAGEETLTPAAERLLAACLIWQGRCGELILDGFELPEKLLWRGLDLARRHDLTVEIGQGLQGLGLLALLQGRREESYAYFEESLALCQRAGISWTAANVLQLMAWLRSGWGDGAAAKEMAEEAIALQRACGDANGEAAALTTLGKIEQDLGDYEAAEGAYGRARALCRRTGHRVGEGQALTGLFGVSIRQGKVVEAAGYAQESLQLNREAGSRLGEGIACHNVGYAWAAQQNHREAITWYRRALALYEGLAGSEGRIANTRRYLEESQRALEENGEA